MSAFSNVPISEGGASFIPEHRPILFGEFNPYWLRQNGHRFVALANLVLPWGYRLFGDDGAGRFTEVAQVTNDLHGLLFLPHDLPRSIAPLTSARG